MEDLMHDLARYHLGDRLIILDGTNGVAPPTPTSSSPVNNNESGNPYKSYGACLALVSNFDAKQQLDIASMLPAAGILALRFENCREMELEVEFESAKYASLLLLDLSGCSVEKKKLPDSIRHLKKLRYLKAKGIQDEVFPSSITGLHELRYLILQGSCQFEYLPKVSERRLSNLLHLDLSGCSGLKTLFDIGRLWKLEHLDLSACSGIEKLPESFGWLRNLRHLYLSGCSGLKELPKSFGMVASLWHLDLSGCSGLQELPKSFGMLASLWHLDLSRCSGLQALPTSFQNLTELRHLDLTGLSMLKSLPMVSLPRELRYLNLSGCSGLLKELKHVKLPHAQDGNELRHLDLSECSILALPMSYAKLEKLVHLNLSGCSSLVSVFPNDREDRDDGGKWTLKKLEHLDLSYCSALKVMNIDYDDIGKLQHLDLSRCNKIITTKASLKVITNLVETIRSRGGSASGPEDASLGAPRQGTNGTTNY